VDQAQSLDANPYPADRMTEFLSIKNKCHDQQHARCPRVLALIKYHQMYLHIILVAGYERPWTKLSETCSNWKITIPTRLSLACIKG